MNVHVRDRQGHEIYLTDERWKHICEEHPEMQDYKQDVLETVRKGRRFQDSFRANVYLYYLAHADLPYDNNTIVVVVHFGFHSDGRENNFVLTSYAIRRQRNTRQ
jgi:hypothetical protein